MLSPDDFMDGGVEVGVICSVGQKLYIYAVYDRIFDGFPAKNIVYTPYIYIYIYIKRERERERERERYKERERERVLEFWPTLIICSAPFLK